MLDSHLSVFMVGHIFRKEIQLVKNVSGLKVNQNIFFLINFVISRQELAEK